MLKTWLVQQNETSARRSFQVLAVERSQLSRDQRLAQERQSTYALPRAGVLKSLICHLVQVVCGFMH